MPAGAGHPSIVFAEGDVTSLGVGHSWADDDAAFCIKHEGLTHLFAGDSRQRALRVFRKPGRRPRQADRMRRTKAQGTEGAWITLNRPLLQT